MNCKCLSARGGLALAAASLLAVGGAPSLAKPASKPSARPAARKAAPPKPAAKAASKTPVPSAIDPELRAAMKRAPKASDYPKENFVQLLDIGTITVQPDDTEIEEYRVTYKLFNKRARDMAEVSLPYNSSYQKLDVLRARTITKEGKVMDVKRNEIRTASPYTDYPLYDDSMYVGFSMPAIEDDCVIDYTYRITSKPIFMKGHFSNTWGFNSYYPVGESRMTVVVPANKPLQYRVYNNDALKPAVSTSKDGATKTYVWEMADMKSLEIESAMPPMHEVITWMDLSTIPDWQVIADWFWGLAKPQMAPNAAIRATVDTLIAGKKTDEEKAAALHDWVTHKVRYVGLEFGLSAYKPHAAAEVHEKLYGDCKDKAILLITMLALAGIKSHPVLVSASEGAAMKGWLPSINAFDHCVVAAEVDGKQVWLDPTDETSDYGETSSSVRDVTMLVVRNGAGELVTTPDYTAEENRSETRAKVALQPEGGAEIEVEFLLPEAVSSPMRYALREMTDEQKKEMAQGMLPGFLPGTKLKSYDLPDPKVKTTPFVYKIAFSSTGWGTRTGSLLIFPVNLAAGGRDSRNPNDKETRVWPLVLENGFRTRSETTITLPDGYKAEELPKDLTLAGPLAEYERRVALSEDGRQLTIAITYTGHEGRIPPGDYKKVKAYYDDVLKANDEQIVLKKAS